MQLFWVELLKISNERIMKYYLQNFNVPFIFHFLTVFYELTISSAEQRFVTGAARHYLF